MLEILHYKLVDINYSEIGVLQVFYFGFNAIEALAWLLFASYVIKRWLINKQSPLEIVYAILFVVFGLTDLLELVNLPIWLLGLKIMTLACLLLMRRHLITNYYTDAKF